MTQSATVKKSMEWLILLIAIVIGVPSPTSGGCKPGVEGCQMWQSDGVKLLLLPSGQVYISRAAPQGY